jgi:hypothetical protein
VAFAESKAAGGTPAAWTEIIEEDQFFISTGGALNSSLTANSFFDMVFEPPFVDGLLFKSESITAAGTRQESRSVDKRGCAVLRSVQGSRHYVTTVDRGTSSAASKPASSALRFICSVPRE